MELKERHFFCIAGFSVSIGFTETGRNGMHLLTSLPTFQTDSPTGEPLLELVVDDTLKPVKGRDKIRNFDTGNGDTIVYLLPDGGYQFIIRDIMGRDCCLLVSNKDFSHCQCALNGDLGMRSFGLNDALMLAFAFAASFHDTVLIHASCVRHGGRAYPFVAKSGTGKSTHVSLWLKYIEGCDLLNDDNPIIRIRDGKPIVYGSPWSGKTPCYRDTEAPLGAITRIDRAPSNSIEQLKGVQAFASLLPCCSTMKWDTDIYRNVCDTVTRIIETSSIFTLHCLPDEEAARLCHATLTKS